MVDEKEFDQVICIPESTAERLVDEGEVQLQERDTDRTVLLKTEQ